MNKNIIALGFGVLTSLVLLIGVIATGVIAAQASPAAPAPVAAPPPFTGIGASDPLGPNEPLEKPDNKPIAPPAVVKLGTPLISVGQAIANAKTRAVGQAAPTRVDASLMIYADFEEWANFNTSVVVPDLPIYLVIVQAPFQTRIRDEFVTPTTPKVCPHYFAVINAETGEIMDVGCSADAWPTTLPRGFRNIAG
jgi:hypothetical protein